MKSIKNNAQAGFTLIELIVVIVILGILAATALPKFAGMSADARVAALTGARSAVVAANQMAHSRYLVNPTVTTIDGVTVTFKGGYPNATALAQLAGLEGFTIDTTGTTKAVITAKGASTTCSFTITDGADATTDADGKPVKAQAPDISAIPSPTACE